MWHLLWNLLKIFFQDLRDCWKHKVLKKKGNLSSDEKILSYFFSYYRTWKKSGDILEGSTKYFDKNCAIVEIISSGPKKSIETNISKNNRFHKYKRFSPIFPRIFECDKTHGTPWKGPQAFVTFTLENKTAFFWTWEIVEITKFWKKGNLSSDEKILAYFFSYYRTWKKSRDILEWSTMYFDKYCAIVKIISTGPKRSIETNFSKTSRFHNYKSFSPNFPRIIECDKTHGTPWKGPQAFVTFTLENKTAFFGREKLLKSQSFEKRATFPVMKSFWPKFSGYLQHEKCQGKFWKKGNLSSDEKFLA